MSARHGPGFRAGPGYRAGPLDVFTPSDISGIIEWWQSYVGGVVTDPMVTVTGSGVSSWLGQFAGKDLAQGTDTNRPARISSDATLNNLQTIDANGSDNYLRDATFTRPAPGTTPTYQYCVWKLNTWTSLRVMSALGSSAMSVQCLTSSPRLVQINPTTSNGNDGLTATATWKRSEFFWNNDTSDYTRIGSSTVMGTDAGNNAGTQLTWGANNGLSTFCAETIAFKLFADRLPTLQELLSLDAYIAESLPASVFT